MVRLCRTRRRQPVLAAVTVLATLLAAAPAGGAARAQGPEAGNLLFVITGPDGAPVPGVMVTVQSNAGRRIEYTFVDGSARFPGLPPGDYRATLLFEGYPEVSRGDLRVLAGRTLLVEIRMVRPDVDGRATFDEQIVVETTSTYVGIRYTDDLIDRTPTASGLWAGVLEHVPGVVTSEIDVGGATAGQQSRLSARGASPQQNVFHVNGAAATDPDALGSSSAYYSVGSFSEISVSTAGHDTGVQTPGVAVQIVTKSGTNDWHGGADISWEDAAFSARNVDDELARRGAGPGDRTTFLRDLDLQVGGPVARDRAWFFVDYWDLSLQAERAGLPAGETDDTRIRNGTVHGTLQLGADHRLSARYLRDHKVRENRGAGPTVPPASAWVQDSAVAIPQLQWQSLLGDSAFVDLRGSRMELDLPLLARTADSVRPHPAFDPDRPTTLERRTGVLDGWPLREVAFRRDHVDVAGSLSWFIDRGLRHDLRAGAEVQDQGAFSPERRGGPFGFVQELLDGAPDRVQLWNTPSLGPAEIPAGAAATEDARRWAAWAQDTWSVADRLTVTAGVRFDASSVTVPQQRRLASPLAALGPAYRAAALSSPGTVTHWKDVVPRIDAVVDLSDDGATTLKGGFSRYSHQQGVVWGRFANPAAPGYRTHLWDDANGDGRFQLGEESTLLRRFFRQDGARVDPDLRSPLTDEWSVGVEHEVSDAMVVSGQVVYRRDGRFIEDVDVGVPYGPLARRFRVADPYTPVPAADPGPDGVVGTADDGPALTVYSADPATFGRDVMLLTHPADLGFTGLKNTYRGLSLVFQRRWSESWQLLASWDVGRSESSFGSGATGTSAFLDDPNSDLGRNGLGTWDRTHVLKVTGNYLFPRPLSLNIGAFLRLQSGAPLLRTAILPAAGGPGVGLAQGPVEVIVAPRGGDPVGPRRLPTVTVLDLRAEKRFEVGRAGVVDVSIDAFNLFNANPVTGQLTGSGPTWGVVSDLLSPRILRLGGSWEF